MVEGVILLRWTLYIYIFNDINCYFQETQKASLCVHPQKLKVGPSQSPAQRRIFVTVPAEVLPSRTTNPPGPHLPTAPTSLPSSMPAWALKWKKAPAPGRVKIHSKRCWGKYGHEIVGPLTGPSLGDIFVASQKHQVWPKPQCCAKHLRSSNASAAPASGVFWCRTACAKSNISPGRARNATLGCSKGSRGMFSWNVHQQNASKWKMSSSTIKKR